MQDGYSAANQHEENVLPVRPNTVSLEQFNVFVIKRLNLGGDVKEPMKHETRVSDRSGTSFSSSSGLSDGVGML
jgi:hypothetical protein